MPSAEEEPIIEVVDGPGHSRKSRFRGEAIDAEFTTSRGKRSSDTSKRTGPGWFSLLGVGAIAAILGTTGAKMFSPASLPAVAGQGASQEALTVLEAQLEGAREARRQLDRQMSALETQSERMRTQIAGLEGLVEAQTAQILEMAEQPVGEVAVLDDTQLTGLSDSIVDLQARLDLIESIEPGEGTAPEELMRNLVVVKEQLDDLTEQVQALTLAQEEMTPNGDAGVAELTALFDQFDESLSQIELDALERADSVNQELSGFATSIDGIQARLEQLEISRTEADARSADQGRMTNAALALSAIEGAVRRGRAFESDFARLETALPDNASVRALQPFSMQSTPTLPELRVGFEDVKAATLAAQTVAPGSGFSWMRDLVSVRRGDEEAVEISERLDQASDLLAEQNLEDALRVLSLLPESAQQTLAPWIENANRRKDLDSVLERLRLLMRAAE